MADIVWQYLNPGRLTPIQEALKLQDELFQKKLEGDRRNYLLVAEHNSVYTYPPRVAHEIDALCKVGKDALPAPLYEMPEQRGGSITYHGPGQLVCYLICDLLPEVFGILGLNKFLALIDAALIEALAQFDIYSHKKPEGLPPAVEGVWVTDNGIPKKIASHGMCARRTKVSQKAPVTKYGCALNVNTDLTYFDSIYVCGHDILMTSMREQTGKLYRLHDVSEIVAAVIVRVLCEVTQGDKQKRQP